MLQMEHTSTKNPTYSNFYMNRQYSHTRILSILFIAIFSMTLFSCEKEISINLQSSAAKVVVQGSIETGGVPLVILNSSIGFFSKVDLGTLQNSFIHGAIVTVSDGTKTIKLKEYTFDTSTSFRFSVYTVDTTNFSLDNIILGEVNKTYTLSITYEGQTYTGVTKIPNPQGVDSMWFAEPQFAGSTTPDSALQLFVSYSDPDTLGDYVRYFTQRNNDQEYPSDIFSDEIINGKKLSSIGLVAGDQNNANANVSRDSLIYFFPGETVTLKWNAIDKGVYKFYNSLQFAKNAVGNPFSSPINPITNMKNGALGVWAGYGVYSKTMVVPHK
jgi:hypothetical protein